MMRAHSNISLQIQEDFIFPHAQDNSCRDVVRTFNGVRECMKHQKDGLRGLATGPEGAWEALTTIVSETKALSEKDRLMVSNKIGGDAVLFTLARLDALHAKCSKARMGSSSRHLGPASMLPKQGRRYAPQIYDPSDPVFQVIVSC
jgi:hypothetical protein